MNMTKIESIEDAARFATLREAIEMLNEMSSKAIDAGDYKLAAGILAASGALIAMMEDSNAKAS